MIAHAQLDTANCTACPIHVKTSSTDYQNLQRKLKKLEEEEEVSQAESKPQKRKTKNPHNSSMYDYSQDLSDGEEIPPAPLSQRERPNDQYLNKSNINHRKTIVEFDRTQKGVLSYEEEIPAVSLLPRDKSKDQHLNKIINHPKKEKAEIAVTPKGFLNKVNSSQQKVFELSKSSSTTLMRNSDKNLTCNCQCKNLDGILKDILRGLEALKSDTKYLLQLNQNKDLELLADTDITCLNSFEESEEFNINIENEDFFRKTTIKVSLIGGKEVGSITRKVLGQIISHPLSPTLNLMGRNHKKGIKDQENLLKLIISSLRRNVNGRNATIDEIESAIKSWLRNAGGRAGGRRSRKKEAVVNTED